jgi:hypothetical protein
MRERYEGEKIENIYIYIYILLLTRDEGKKIGKKKE